MGNTYFLGVGIPHIIPGNIEFLNNVTIHGNLTVKGNMVFGDATLDTTIFSGSVSYTNGVAVTAGSYQYHLDAVNRLHANVPTGGAYEWSVNGTTLFLMTANSLTYTQVAATSGIPTILTLTGAAHTGITASTLCPSIIFNSSATKTWATGNITGAIGQYEYAFKAPTYAFAGASTVSVASTVYIEGAPIAGANATLSSRLALFVDSGSVRFDGGGESNAGFSFNALAYFNGGYIWEYTTPGSYPYTVLSSDVVVVVDTSAPRTINLPALAGIPNGWTVHFKDLTGTAATNNITIDGNGTELIDESQTQPINTNYGSMTLIKHSTKWLIL